MAYDATEIRAHAKQYDAGVFEANIRRFIEEQTRG
jgi:hypothetical protein